MEPERPIEKLLRAFVKKRREQAGQAPEFDLHPATRRLLQSEVARRAPPAREGNLFLRLFSPARPRLAYALAAAAVVVLGVALLLPSINSSKSRQQLASDNTRSFGQAEQPAGKSAAPPPATPQPARLSTDSDSAASLRKLDVAVDDEMKKQTDIPTPRERRAEGVDTPGIAASDQSEMTPRSRVVTTGGLGGFGGDSLSTNASASGRIDLAYKTESASREKSPAGAAVPAATGTSTFAGNLSLAAAGGDVRIQQFDDLTVAPARASTPAQNAPVGGREQSAATQTATRSFYALRDESGQAGEANLNRQIFAQLNEGRALMAGISNRVSVLTNFAVELNGRQLRVVDSDRSVYDGLLQPAREPVGAASGNLAQTDAFAAKDAADKSKNFDAVQNYSFRVTGTNRSLNQNVVFAGNLLVLTNAANILGVTTAVAPGMNQAEASSAVPQQLPLQNSVINGTIQINNAREIPIQATPVPASSPR